MIIVGELINGSRHSVGRAIEHRDAECIAQLAQRQVDAGATWVDVNSARVGEQEIEDLRWLVQAVADASDCPVSVDSAEPEATAAALAVYDQARPPLINSVNLDEARLRAIVPLALDSGASVIALATDDTSVPGDGPQRVEIALRLLERLVAEGIGPDRIFLDPVVMPLSTSHESAAMVYGAIEAIRAQAPECHVICGISNVSYGLPQRAALNRAFLAQAILAGLDAAILDPLDAAMMQTAYAAEALAGRDEWCLEYIGAHRGGQLG